MLTILLATPAAADNILTNRGFDPTKINSDLLIKFKLGITDTFQSDMIARIRQTVPMIYRNKVNHESISIASKFDDFAFIPSSDVQIQEELISYLKGRTPRKINTVNDDVMNKLIIDAILQAQNN